MERRLPEPRGDSEVEQDYTKNRGELSRGSLPGKEGDLAEKPEENLREQRDHSSLCPRRQKRPECQRVGVQIRGRRELGTLGLSSRGCWWSLGGGPWQQWY